MTSAPPLPRQVVELTRIPERHLFADRNVVIVEAALLHGLGSTEIAALNAGDVDLARRCFRRPRSKAWLPLHTSHWASWHRLTESADPSRPLCQSKSGRRMTRVDIWRVLRRVGIEGGLQRALHSRRARKWVGHALARRERVDPASLALAMGVSDLRAIAAYLPTGATWSFPTQAV
ncbi:tyrosine-type recombinase/integrase [Luteimonas aquatica]|uniref:tyrosine-type recombinase/integrase n=1 Tax=Luteimonas aquatica TaxID=450364 RepID=UPI003CE536A4